MPASRVIKKRLPVSPGKDSHFTIRHHGAEWWVFCEAPDGELVPADSPHKDLVALVNGLKEAEGNSPGGPFSINEHSQVIARMAAPPGYKQNTIYVVSTVGGSVQKYATTITFQAGALDPRAKPVEGDPWTGPLCGSSYRFAAPGNKKPPFHNLDEIWTEIEGHLDLLSSHIKIGTYPPKTGALAVFIQALRLLLPSGGRFRVNEHGRAFTSKDKIFIGTVPFGSWFPPISTSD